MNKYYNYIIPIKKLFYGIEPTFFKKFCNFVSVEMCVKYNFIHQTVENNLYTNNIINTKTHLSFMLIYKL
jgi:hypothetical protein